MIVVGSLLTLSEGDGYSDLKDSSLSTRVTASEDTELRDPSLLRKCNFVPMSDDALLSGVGDGFSGLGMRRVNLPFDLPAQLCSPLRPLFRISIPNSCRKGSNSTSNEVKVVKREHPAITSRGGVWMTGFAMRTNRESRCEPTSGR